MEKIPALYRVEVHGTQSLNIHHNFLSESRAKEMYDKYLDYYKDHEKDERPIEIILKEINEKGDDWKKLTLFRGSRIFSWGD